MTYLLSSFSMFFYQIPPKHPQEIENRLLSLLQCDREYHKKWWESQNNIQDPDFKAITPIYIDDFYYQLNKAAYTTLATVFISIFFPLLLLLLLYLQFIVYNAFIYGI